MDLDDEELEATRKLNGVVKKSNIEEDIKYIKECLKIARVFFKSIKAETDYKEIDDVAFCIAIDNILAERKQNKTRIQELEEENKKYIVQLTDKEYRNLVDIIRKEAKQEFEQKVKDVLTEIQEEYNKVQEQFDCIWNKKSKDDYDRYKLQEFSAMQQQLGFFIGKLEELLEDK